MHLIEKAALFTEITVEESATVSGGVDIGSALGNLLVSQASVYYSEVIAASNKPSSTTTTPILPVLAINSNFLINV